MKNSIARPKSWTFLPPLQSATRQTLDGKSEPGRDGRFDLVEALPRMVHKLSINENVKRDTSKLIQEARIQKEEITEHDLKKVATPLYNIDEMSPEELQASLRRIAENPRQPFSFLTNISNEFVDDNRLSMKAKKPTEIDIELAAVAKRIESSKILLAETKSYMEDIHLRIKQDARRLPKVANNNNYDDKTKIEQASRVVLITQARKENEISKS